MNEDEENDEGEATGASWEVGRDGLIFLIDATKPMFTKVEDGNESAFEICLKCAHNVLMSKIISSDKDLVGIIFFGTGKHKNLNDFENVYNFQELDLPDANRILELENLSSHGLNKFNDTFGHCNEFELADALWSCSNMFANSTYKLAQKRILLFTSTDDPHRSKRDVKNRAVKKAKDLADLGIELELLHLKQGNDVFDVKKFYRDIISEEEFDGLSDPTEKFEELLTRVRSKEFKKRAVTRIPLQLAENLALSVSVYTLNRPATKGAYVKLDSRTNEEVKCVTKYMCADTGHELFPTDIKYYQEFGGAKVIYEKEELVQMKNLVKPGIHLIGFKPRKYLKDYYHVKGSSFLYPDESMVAGSTPLFNALLKRCLAKEVTPICVVATRASIAPRLAALLPQEEEFDGNHVQIKPPGFHLVYLPYSDDIRKVKVESCPKATDEQIDKAKCMIDKLKFKYTPDMFENPAIQKFYRCLEAFALERDEVEEFQDLTLPNNETIDNKAGTVINEFKEMVFPKDYTDAVGTKRKANSATGGASKKTKTEMVDINMQDVAIKGNLNKLTVAVMKTFCQANKIKSTSQKKADLISAISNHFSIG